MLSRPNCPVLDAWGILYALTARVLLGAWQRPRIRQRALRARPLHPRASYSASLRAGEIPFVELAIIVDAGEAEEETGNGPDDDGHAEKNIAFRVDILETAEGQEAKEHGDGPIRSLWT